MEKSGGMVGEWRVGGLLAMYIKIMMGHMLDNFISAHVLVNISLFTQSFSILMQKC